MKWNFLLLAFVLAAIRATPGGNSLSTVADIPLPGNPNRFDYQSVDTQAKILYLNHMNDSELVIFDIAGRKVIDHLKGFPRCTGVIALPPIHKVFVSTPGNHEVAILDMKDHAVLARLPAGRFPDGLAYSPDSNKVYVSDESGGKEIIIDAALNKRVGEIDMGGEVGNTQYDSGSHMIFANVQSKNQLVAIDPKTDTIAGKHTLNGGEWPHGLLIDAPKRLAFVACEGDSKLLVVDLGDFQVKQVFTTGKDPDVLAFDSKLERLYVATESEIVSVFQLTERKLEKIEDAKVAPHAHTISVDPETHEIYLPLQDIGGHPVLRIMKPSSK